MTNRYIFRECLMDYVYCHFFARAQVPSEWGRSDETGYEECIVPSDMNLLSGTLLHIVRISNP